MMRMRQGIAVTALALTVLVWTGDEAAGQRGGGRGGGGRGGGGGGGFGGGGGARPAPSPAPRPAPAPSPRPAPSPSPSPRPSPPVTGPGGGAKPGNLPSTGGSIGGPNGGVVGGGKGPTTLPATGGGSIVGGGKVGPGLPNGPGTGPGTPGRPGTPGVGPGTPGRLPGDGGLGAIAKTNPLAPKAGTLPVNRQTLNNRGVVVRNNFNHYDCFHGNWWGRYPGAWRAARWGTAAVVWGTASWAACSSYCGYPAEPVYYDYGSTVVYQGDSVYVNGDAVATQEQYAQQATTIADTGKQAQASKDEDWLPLGVFGMVQGEQTSANDLFQLAVNKAGVIRGNYYNALSDATLPVYGSVDKKSQRAAWTVGDKKEPIYEAGFANLTKAETTMLVHFGKDRTQQWTLVRIEQPPEQKK